MMLDDAALDKIRRAAVEHLSVRHAQHSNLYIQAETYEQPQAIMAQHEMIPVERESTLVFSDDNPLLNWSHPCRYLLYDPGTGELISEKAATFPPYLTEPPDTYQAFHKAVDFAPEQTLQQQRPPPPTRVAPPHAEERYAVLFSGASEYRHVNDLELLYRCLVDDYSFSEDNIYVLNYNGHLDCTAAPRIPGQWPGDGTPYRMKIGGAGTKADLDGVLDHLRTRLGRDDSLLIHTNNHGGHDAESYLCTYDNTPYLASDFAAKLSRLPAFRSLIVMMEQCHAGGFNDPIIAASPTDMVSVSSACGEYESSIGGQDFDPFARAWISAMRGIGPYGRFLPTSPDQNRDGSISVHEAFEYAKANGDRWDTPLFSEAGGGARACHLALA